ncbi:hypothetical protein MTP99_007453 [Tenebrio molitor]|nr:hypothetical protein MTP99_007453 [Tenebrio molitor]
MKTLIIFSVLSLCNAFPMHCDECLSKAVQNTIAQLDKPGAQTNPNIKLRNYRVYGRIKIDSAKAKMNFEDNTLTVELSHPEIRYELDYEPKGKMFILPYDSAGHGTVTLKNPTYTTKFTLEEYLSDNKKYLRALNDAFNREMNENWKLIFAKSTTPYLNSYAQIYGDVFNNFLEVVPLVNLFEGVQ